MHTGQRRRVRHRASRCRCQPYSVHHGARDANGKSDCTGVKISTNSSLAERMQDIIDIDTGAVISGERTIEEMGDALLERVVEVASGQMRTKAELLGQDDFIPWKRGVSL